MKAALDPQRFGKRIQKLRKERGFTQEGMADALNISRVDMGRLEQGKSVCSIDILIELSELLDCSTDFLLLGENCKSGRQREKLLTIATQIIELANTLVNAT